MPDEDAAAPALTRAEAQRRADRIAAFRAELAALESEGQLALPAADRERVEGYHQRLLAGFAARFDVDVGEGEKQLSLGMRLASLFGALALAASAYFFFYRFWGLLSTPFQVAILVVAPIAGVVATGFAARREATGYFATLAALVAYSCFVLDLAVLGVVFNLVPSPRALLAWGAFGLVLAYAYRLRVVLFAGLGFLVFWSAAELTAVGGAAWQAFDRRPEAFLPAGLLLCALPSLVAHRARAEFAPLYRIVGLLALFTAILWLAYFGESSLLPFAADTVEGTYQVLGFVGAAGAVWLGVRRRWKEAINLGSIFFVVYLCMKFVDWWWDWMPKYLFFLIVGAVAVAVLVALKRLRSAMGRGGGGAG